MMVEATVEHLQALTPREHEVRMAERLGVNLIDFVGKAVEDGSAWTAMADDKPIAICGIIQNGLFAPSFLWLVTTPLVDERPVQFLRESKWLIRQVRDTYAPLYGYVDAEYTLSQKWMEWLGFERDPELVDFEGMKLVRYQMRAGNGY